MIQVGDVLQNRYTIVRPLGSGGFGAVFLATDNRLADRPVALKYFATGHLSADEEAAAAQLFQQEAHTLANLNHPNLTQVLDYFEVDHGWVLVMAYVPGDTLATLQKRLNGPFGQEQVINWSIEICEVLEYLHAQRPPLVFRDLKPSNIMRTPDGRIMLIDFGIARTFKEGQHQDTIQLGTPGYAPPEQYGGQTEPRSDLYSLGATMFVMLTNERLTGGFKIPSVRSIAPHVSTDLDTLVQQLTALRPEERPASAKVVRNQLERLKQGQPINSAPPVQKPYRAPVGGQNSGPDAPTVMNPGRTPRASQQAAPATPVPTSNSTASSGRSTRSPSQAASRRFGTGAIIGIIALVLLCVVGGAYAFGGSLFGMDTSSDSATSGPGQASNGQPVTSLIVTSRIGDSGAFDLFEMQLADGSTRKLIPNHSDNAIADRRRSDGKLVYTHGVADSSGRLIEQIFTINADGSSEQQLTSGDSVNRAPRWSLDGTKIAFESSRDATSGNERDIYVMDADGSNVRRITTEAGWQGGPAWSPDGTRLAIHEKTGDRFELAIVELESGQKQTLVAFNEEAFWPDWSPDGTKVAFMTGAGNDTGVYVVDVASGDLQDLTNDLGPGINRWPRWSPDGKQLAFESQRDGQWQVYVYTLEDSSVRKVSNGQRNDRWPMW